MAPPAWIAGHRSSIPTPEVIRDWNGTGSRHPFVRLSNSKTTEDDYEDEDEVTHDSSRVTIHRRSPPMENARELFERVEGSLIGGTVSDPADREGGTRTVRVRPVTVKGRRC